MSWKTGQVVLVLACAACGPEAPEVQWTRMLDFVDLTDLAPLPEGGVVAVGSTVSTETFDGAPFGQGTYRPYAVWLSEDGDVAWESVGYSRAYGEVEVDGNGQVYATGRVGDTALYLDMGVYALDRYGQHLWEFQGGEPQTFRELAGDPGGGVFVGADHRVWSLASDGAVRWSVDSGDDRIKAVVAGEDGAARVLVERYDWDRTLLVHWTISRDGSVREEDVRVPGESDLDPVALGPDGVTVVSASDDAYPPTSPWSVFVLEDLQGPLFDLEFAAPLEASTRWEGLVAVGGGGLLMAGHAGRSDEDDPAVAVLRAYDGNGGRAWEREFQLAESVDEDTVTCPATDAGPGRLYGTAAERLIPGLQSGQYFVVGRQNCRGAWISALEEL